MSSDFYHLFFSNLLPFLFCSLGWKDKVSQGLLCDLSTDMLMYCKAKACLSYIRPQEHGLKSISLFPSSPLELYLQCKCLSS